LKKQTILLSLLALAIAVTVGCGTSTTGAPTFTKVAFLSNRTVTPPTVLFTANLDGTNVTPIPFSTTSVRNLSSSADGKTVAFIANTGTGNGIWVEKADGSGQLQMPGVSNPDFVRISPDGKKLTYNDNSGHISVINIDGTGNLDLTPTLPANMVYCFEPSFSADSSLIAFTCGAKVSGSGIYTIKADGSGIKTVEVRASGFYADYAFLTPDGKKVIFIGNLGANGNAVISVNIDGTGETLLVPNAGELVILNSNLYYDDPCASTVLVFKANLDGTKPVLVNDSSNNADLYYVNSGGC